MEFDKVKKPKHYNVHPKKIECIEITQLMNFNIGCAFKYLFRYGLKGDAVEDLNKAITYLEFEKSSLMNYGHRSNYSEAAVSHDVKDVIEPYPEEIQEAMFCIWKYSFGHSSEMFLDKAIDFINKRLEHLEERAKSLDEGLDEELDEEGVVNENIDDMILSVNDLQQDNSINFEASGKTPLILTSEGFYYNSEKVEDKGEAHRLFMDWLRACQRDTQGNVLEQKSEVKNG